MRRGNRKTRHLKLIDVPRYEQLIEAIKKAYRYYKRGKYSLRDLAFVSVLVFTGCRINEAISLTRKDIDLKHKTVRIRQEKKIEERVRIVPVVSNLFWFIITDYLRYVDDKLFTFTDRHGRNIVYKFTTRFLGRRIRPHAIRHSFAIFILRKTRDIETVRRLLGHEKYDWLKDYLDYSQEDLEEDLIKAFMELGV